MGFVQNIFASKKLSKTVALVDIRADSIAGAYAHYAEDKKPVVLYTQRLPVAPQKDRPHEQAIMRALCTLGDTLIREGAPVLSRAIGRGTADAILISVDAPWAEVQTRTKHLNPKDSFIFTKELVATALEDAPSGEKKTLLVNEGVVGTTLNGYETREPYGKSASRATIIAFASHVDRTMLNNITKLFRGLFHTEQISLIAAPSLRYQALQRTFPHERGACTLDAMGPSPSLTFVRGGVPVSVSIQPSHLAEHVVHRAPTPPDLNLLLMALYGEHRTG